MKKLFLLLFTVICVGLGPVTSLNAIPSSAGRKLTLIALKIGAKLKKPKKVRGAKVLRYMHAKVRARLANVRRQEKKEVGGRVLRPPPRRGSQASTASMVEAFDPQDSRRRSSVTSTTVVSSRSRGGPPSPRRVDRISQTLKKNPKYVIVAIAAALGVSVAAVIAILIDEAREGKDNSVRVVTMPGGEIKIKMRDIDVSPCIVVVAESNNDQQFINDLGLQGVNPNDCPSRSKISSGMEGQTGPVIGPDPGQFAGGVSAWLSDARNVASLSLGRSGLWRLRTDTSGTLVIPDTQERIMSLVDFEQKTGTQIHVTPDGQGLYVAAKPSGSFDMEHTAMSIRDGRITYRDPVTGVETFKLQWLNIYEGSPGAGGQGRRSLPGKQGASRAANQIEQSIDRLYGQDIWDRVKKHGPKVWKFLQDYGPKLLDILAPLN